MIKATLSLHRFKGRHCRDILVQPQQSYGDGEKPNFSGLTLERYIPNVYDVPRWGVKGCTHFYVYVWRLLGTLDWYFPSPAQLMFHQNPWNELRFLIIFPLDVLNGDDDYEKLLEEL